MRLFPAILLMMAPCLYLAGCTPAPELDAAISAEAKVAPAPRLTDNQIVLAPASGLLLDEATQEQMTARGTALKERAKVATAGPVISPEEAAAANARAARLREQAAAQVADGN